MLVRQKPGSAKGVMFVTIEDETGVANLVIWPALFEQQRRVILTAGMLAVDGRIQREGEVVHVIASRLHDLSRHWPASAIAMEHSRCRTAAATKLITPCRAPIREHHARRSRAISTSVICPCGRSR